MESRAAKVAFDRSRRKSEFWATVKIEKGKNWIKVHNFMIHPRFWNDSFYPHIEKWKHSTDSLVFNVAIEGNY